MFAAEWIHVVVFSFFVVLAWLRPLPGNRRIKILKFGALGITATLCGAYALPRVLAPDPASVIRDWLPAALMLLVYNQAGAFFVRIDNNVQERLLRIDALIVAPFLAWLARIRLGGLLVLYFELAYLLCYAMIPMSVGALYLLDRTAYVNPFWMVVLVSTYLAYGMLPFVQTLPPRVLSEPWFKPLPIDPVRRFNLWVLRNGSIHANTFPSAHVAASTAAALVLYTVLPPPVAILFVVIAVGILFGTFVGRYHYVSDAILGCAIAVAVFLGIRPRWPW